MKRSLNWAHLLANYFVHSLYKKWKENKILHRSVYVWSVFLYPSTDESATIRVTNLSEDTRESDLMELFRPFGPISRIFLAKDKQTNQSKVISFQQWQENLRLAPFPREQGAFCGPSCTWVLAVASLCISYQWSFTNRLWQRPCSLSFAGFCIYQFCSPWRCSSSYSKCARIWLWSSHLECGMGQVSGYQFYWHFQ